MSVWIFKNMQNPKLIFYGGVGSTTGANIMLEFENHKILVDCGLFQGTRENEEKNFENFKFNPKEIEFLLITHAHMDHIGQIPKLVRAGFGGKIISTKETFELARPMLHDALKVLKMRHPSSALFEEADIEKALSLWQGENYDEKIDLFDDCNLVMKNAGHILGSAILNVFCGGKKIAFTGDLGNSPSPLLPDTESPEGVDYLVMESVYGDRNHESKEERRKKLKQTLLDGIKRGGEIVIPAFSMERTQILLYEINNMIEDGEIPKVPVFLDSPLAQKVTEIYKKYEGDFKESVKKEIKAGDDIFEFPGLKIIKNFEESQEIGKIVGPKIILAGSGMSEGGRVLSHESRILGDPRNTLILVGYQSVGTLGRRLEEGVKEITIKQTNSLHKIKIKAKIEVIKGYSSHMDSEHLLEFVEKAKPHQVFVIMGEPKSALFLTQRIRDYLDIPATYPEEGKEYELK